MCKMSKQNRNVFNNIHGDMNTVYSEQHSLGTIARILTILMVEQAMFCCLYHVLLHGINGANDRGIQYT